jgi:hypothetical protein
MAAFATDPQTEDGVRAQVEMTNEIDCPEASPDDVDWWRRAISHPGTLGRLRPEDIVGAAQDPRIKAERRLYNALMQHLSEFISRKVRTRVSRQWKNGGQDIVDNVHDKLIEAILRPSSPDGKELGRRFWAVLRTRTIDAIRVAEKERDRFTNHEDEIVERPEREVEVGHTRVEQKIDYDRALERALECVPDVRKRLAYRLHLQGVPCKTTKGTTSISAVVGISSKTAGEWIDEVDATVKEKIGEKND